MCVTNYISSLVLLPNPGTLFFLLCLIFFFWLCHATCGISVPQPGIEPAAPAVEVRGPNRWAAGKGPVLHVFPLALSGVTVSANIWTWLIFMDAVVPRALMIRHLTL